jgi:hypothetical protein
VTRLLDTGVIRQWDSVYRAPAGAVPVFLACTSLTVNVHDPARIRRADWIRWCGKVPGTQTPPEISDSVWERLVGLAQRRAA